MNADVRLEAGELEASFAPAAGMVCHSLRHAGEELLNPRHGLRAYAETGSTMGIPMLHPWANRLSGWFYTALGRKVDLERARGVIRPDRATGLPIHGCLPGPWQLREQAPERVVAERTPTREPGFDAAFPFPHRLELEATLDETTLRLRTTLHSLGAPVPVAFGYHPYFTLPGVARSDYRIELPARRRLLLDDRKLATGGTQVLEPFDGPLGGLDLDDAFDQLSAATFAVSGGGRRVEVRFEEGYGLAQVFAPSAREVICFEPMTAPADALRTGTFPVATADAPYSAAFSVSVGA